MVFEWSHRYKVDIREVDDQHKHFVDVVNTLFEAMERGEGPKVLAQTLDALARHASEHFELEHKYMRECRYPDLGRHEAAHLEFRETLQGLQQMARTEDPRMFTVRLAEFLRGWLVSHVQVEDKRMFEYRASVRPPKP